MTKERHIPFTGDMARALLDGSKTQTRRAMKTQMLYGDICGLFPSWYLPTGPDRGTLWPNGKEAILATCPYGQPGDQLWVREHYRVCDGLEAKPPRDLCPAARIWYEADAPHQPGFGKFRPAMFMCRWMSRTLLEIVSVRVERLQDISEADALAEGIQALVDAGVDHDGTPQDAYRALWESINGPGSWALNPWVWVVEFKRINP